MNQEPQPGYHDALLQAQLQQEVQAYQKNRRWDTVLSLLLCTLIFAIASGLLAAGWLSKTQVLAAMLGLGSLFCAFQTHFTLASGEAFEIRSHWGGLGGGIGGWSVSRPVVLVTLAVLLGGLAILLSLPAEVLQATNAAGK